MLRIHQGTTQIVSYRNNELMTSSPFQEDIFLLLISSHNEELGLIRCRKVKFWASEATQASGGNP